jgi:hypothetical protein
MADEKSDEPGWEDAAREVAEGAVRAVTKGEVVGDFTMQGTVSLSTDDHLDTNENRERTRRGEEDARAAQQAGAVAPEDAIAALRRKPPPAPEHTALDDALDDARARAAGTADLPMILHDPLTGQPIGGS